MLFTWIKKKIHSIEFNVKIIFITSLNLWLENIDVNEPKDDHGGIDHILRITTSVFLSAEG